jgi:hypothetical protein
MGDGLIVLGHNFQLLKVNEVAKNIVLNFNQLPFFVREIKSLEYKDSIIDLVVLKPKFMILSCNVKFFDFIAGEGKKGVIINFRDVTRLQREKSLKNRLLSILAEQVADYVLQIKAEIGEKNLLSTLEEKVVLQSHFIRMESGPLRLDRKKHLLKELVYLKDKELEIECNLSEDYFNKEQEFDLEAMEFAVNTFFSLGNVEKYKVELKTEEELEFVMHLLVPKPFDTDLEILVNSNYDIFEIMSQVEDNEIIKRAVFIKVAFSKNVIESHGGNLEVKLEREEDTLKAKIKYMFPLLGVRDKQDEE